KFEVIQLRRLDAESVAGSIQFLMGAKEEKDNSNNSSRYFYWDYGSRNDDKKKNDDKMRVGANVNDNQVLLWANEVEMEEVRNLLVKLGEIPAEGARPSNVRVIDASRQPETLEYLKKLQERWNRVSPNPLILPGAEEFKEPEPPTRKDESPEQDGTPEPEPALKDEKAVTAAYPLSDNPRFTSTITAAGNEPADDDSAKPSEETASEETANTEPASEEAGSKETAAAGASSEATANTEPSEAGAGSDAAGAVAANAPKGADRESELDAAARPRAMQPPPIEIMIDDSGNLVLRSEDTAALDQLEQLMQANKPPKRPYDLFYVKYARASWIALNLEDYFKNEDKKGNDSRDRFFSWYFGMPSESKSSTPDRQLGKKKPLRFLSDNDTNSIIVQGANDTERQTIQELIDLWDVAEPINDTNVRYSKIVKIKYSQAESIAEVIKDAYRDYLSASDKTFQQQNQQQAGRNGSESKRNSSDAMVSSGGGDKLSLKGKLSVGVDPVTNSIVVFAQGKALLDVVCKMIDELDESARPQGNIEIYQLSPDSNSDAVGQALRAIMSKSKEGQNAQPSGSNSESRERSSSRSSSRSDRNYSRDRGR
ncbi:MAG: secretin N-terminal domain-containing protein, partial [Aureliella sp.]